MKRLGVVLLVLLVAPASTHAASLPPGPWAGWVDQMRVPPPPIYDVINESCPDDTGQENGSCTAPGDRVWISPGNLPSDARLALYHELGHQFDYQVSTHRLRQRFRRVAHVRGPWVQRDSGHDPHELFADAYMLCALTRHAQQEFDDGDGRIESPAYDYRAKWKPHRRFCKLLRAIRARYDR